MGWSAGEGTEPSRLWNVEEAELTYHLEQSRIGFAQVGLDVNPTTALMSAVEGPPPGVDRSKGFWAPVPELDDAGPSTDPAIAISPLIQCLDDSLRWFGGTEISAYQVTGYDLQPRPVQYALASVLGWFCVVIPAAMTPAIVTLASAPRRSSLVTEVHAGIQGSGADFFEFGPLVDTPKELAAGTDWDWIQLTCGDAGIAVTLPEWSTAAVGWLIGRVRVFEAALSLESAPQALSVRVTRSTLE